VDKDGIDASIGLAFSLDLFRRYKRSGILQAELCRLPGMSGSGVVSLHLVGVIVTSSALLANRAGKTTLAGIIVHSSYLPGNSLIPATLANTASCN
jgi:hypothetical protein